MTNCVSVRFQIRPSPCPGCFPPRRLFATTTTPSLLEAAPRRITAKLQIRHQSNRSSLSDDTPPLPTPSPTPSPSPSIVKEREHTLSEAAAKATQQHSAPEGPGAHERDHESASHDVTKSTDVTEKEQSRRDWEIIKKLVPNIWPKDDWGTKTRVMLAVGLLVGGKVHHQSVTDLADR